jgi:hypothetical protein
VKPTNVLASIPLAVALLSTDPSFPVHRSRVGHVLLCLALFAVLTSPSWLGNLLLSGKPIYAPWTTLRLDVRYGLLPFPEEFVRRVRFGMAPLGYRELVARFALAHVLGRELQLGVDLLRDVFRPEASLTMSWGGSALFLARGPHRRLAWLATLLCAGPLFECCYMHTELRYLWPLVPVFLFLAVLATLELLERARRRARPALARALPLLTAALLGIVIASSARGAAWRWRGAIAKAAWPEPPWTSAVRNLPRSAVVMSTDPWAVAWYCDRLGVITPRGGRLEFDLVQAQYRPGYLVAQLADVDPCPPDASGLRELDRGRGWVLLRFVENPGRQRPASAADRSRGR